jgi:uncharacterized RDD family membrane protein YckC
MPHFFAELFCFFAEANHPFRKRKSQERQLNHKSPNVMNWYYVDGARNQAGPVDEAAFDALIASGTITAETLVWREGMANWLPLREARPGTAPAGAATVTPATGQGEAVCAECGRLFQFDDTIQIGNARVCASCKPVFVQKMREGLDVGQAGQLNYAGFGTRFAAYFLDFILLYAVNTVINLAAGFGVGGFGVRGNANPTFGPLFVLLFFLEVAIGVTYETLMVGKYGATLGKMACKIRVVNADGAPVGYGRALGRYFAKMVSAFTCLIGFIMAAFDSEKRALHDRICNTRVVAK